MKIRRLKSSLADIAAGRPPARTRVLSPAQAIFSRGAINCVPARARTQRFQSQGFSYEAAMNANPRSDPRHRLEHVILATAQATRKMKDLGVVVSTQPAFIYLFGEGWNSLFGAERMERIMVTQEWIKSGVHVAIGSDAPSTPFYHPQATMAGAMTRYTFKQNTIGADQKLSFTEALRAHTYEGAYSGHQENVKGTLEIGKFADLVVWTTDPTTLSPEDLFNSTVDLTMVGGKIVFKRT